MRFRILNIDDQKKLQKLSKVKKTFFSKKEDLNLFHYYNVNSNMFHAIFHINDEYLVGTKKSGNYLNVPFSQYINCFFFTNSNLFLIEDMDEAYLQEIKDYISNKTDSIIDNYKFSKDSLKRLVGFFNGLIKKVEYHDEFNDDYEKDFTTFEQFSEINNRYEIDYISMNVKEQFISIYTNGRISVDNSDEDYLFKLAGDVINELESSHN